VLWVGVIGALATGIVAGTILMSVEAVAAAQIRVPWKPVAGLIVIVTAGAAIAGLQQLLHRRPPTAESVSVASLGDAADRFIAEHGNARPVVHIAQDAWPVAAGIVLRLYKHGRPVAVEHDWVSMFGPSFAPAGREIPLMVADRRFHESVERSPGIPPQLIASDGDVYLYALGDGFDPGPR
jgi:hypothetical protein